jgi:hypothetical protein
MSDLGLPPWVTATADQELAEINDLLDGLIAAYRGILPVGGMELDQATRVAVLMVTETCRTKWMAGVLAMAVARLADGGR